jgi:hypothetical protein
MVLFDKYGDLSWSKTFSPITGASSSTIYIKSVYFANTSKVAFLVCNGNIFVIFIDVSTGLSVTNYHSDITSTSYSFNINGMVASSGGSAYITGQKGTAWSLTKLKSTSGGGSYYSYTTEGTTFGSGYVVILGETSPNQALYVGGYMQISSTDFNQY